MSQGLLTVQRTKNGESLKKSTFRPDIQGLRALAVLVVIADHLVGYPRGGFVGVDVFFVISGFIITGMMLHEHKKSGHISLANFYRRRVRRIMPVAVVVLAITVLASRVLFIGERAVSISWDALASTLFWANWRFASVGTDYMQADGPVSPLQHFWSLSVEEQFYLVWPVLLIAILGVSVKGFGWSEAAAKRALGLVLLFLIGASLAFAQWESVSAPTVAYFSTFSRAWEMGIGALVAVCAPLLARIPKPIRPLIQWAGLTGILISLFVITPSSQFPAPGAILPVVATAMVLAGGIGSQHFMLPLTNRFSRYIGDISYSLYLWHFPVIVLVEAAIPSLGPIGYLSILFAVFLLSVASYEFIENPIRHSQWLEPKTARPRGRQQRPFELPLRKQILGLTLLAVAATGAVGAALARTAPSEQVSATPASIPRTSEEPSAPATPEELLQSQVTTAASASTWPTLTPTLETLGAKGFEKEDSEGCAPATPNGKFCGLEGAVPEKLAYVVGDSMGAAWVPSIKAALEPLGWTVKTMTYVGCPFLDADTVAADDSITRSCSDHKALVRSVIDETQPDLVVVSNLYNLNLSEGITGDAAVSSWEAGAKTARGEWLAGADKVVTLAPPPAGQDPKACITRISSPPDCASSITDTWLAYAAADKRVSQIADDDLYLDQRSWFCTSARVCPVFIDGTIVRRDATHMTAEYAVRVAPLLAEALAPVLR